MSSDEQKPDDFSGTLHGPLNITLVEKVKLGLAESDKGTKDTTYDKEHVSGVIDNEAVNFLSGTLNITSLRSGSNSDYSGTLESAFSDVMKGKFKGELSGSVSGKWNHTIAGTFKGQFTGKKYGTLHGTLNGTLCALPNGKLISDLGGSFKASSNESVSSQSLEINAEVNRVNLTLTDKFTGTMHAKLNGSWATTKSNKTSRSMFLDGVITFYVLCVVASIICSYWFIKSILANNPTRMSHYIIFNGIHIVFSTINSIVFGWFFLLVALVDIYFFMCAKTLKQMFLDTIDIETDNVHTMDNNSSSQTAANKPTTSYDIVSPEGWPKE